MACYHPLNAYVFHTKLDGKKILKFLPKNSDAFMEFAGLKQEDFIKIPCGKCIGCRLDYSRHWADRCMLEAKCHDKSYFVTLTYDDEHLPPCREGSEIHSLRKEDMTKFMKDLRSQLFDDYVNSNEIAKLYYSKKKGSHWRANFERDYPDEYRIFIENVPRVRFFGCGEYGAERNRPHLHILLFGISIEDLQIFRYDRKHGYIYYTSDFIRNVWNNGHVIITDLTWETCAYTARYIMKKQKGDKSVIYEKLNYEPEFVLMSRKPGIAKQWFLEHPEVVDKSFYIETDHGSKTINSNKYFDTIFADMFPDKMEEIKEKRRERGINNMNMKLEKSSLKYFAFLESQEKHKEDAIKSLKRKL